MRHEYDLCSRRRFLKLASAAALATPFLAGAAFAGEKMVAASPSLVSNARVAVVSCKEYGPQTRVKLAECFDKLGGIGALVKNKTVTVKINLTGTMFRPIFRRPVGESYMTHFDTVSALVSLLFQAGAVRVRLVESTNSLEPLEKSLTRLKWDLKSLTSLGKVEYENTRGRGISKSYATLKVPGQGLLFSHFDLNRAYEDTDVFVSLAKMKNHSVCGITLAMKNLFGVTPNALYGDDAGNENGCSGRGRLHNPSMYSPMTLPGEIKQTVPNDEGYRVPRIVADICAARPIHLSIIDAITTMRGGEGPWCEHVDFVSPGLILAGLNPLSTDAVSTAIMGCKNPLASRGTPPFMDGDNHLVFARKKGLGVADISRIEILGMPIEKARFKFS